MARERTSIAQYITAAIDASLNAFVITFLWFFSAAVFVLVCTHFGLINLTAFDPRAWDAAGTVRSKDA